MSNHPKIPKSSLEDTLVYAISEGAKEGYQSAFEFRKGSMYLENTPYRSKDIQVDLEKRFEGMTNPADAMIYYRLSTADGSKGYFISSYGPDADHEALTFIARAESDNSTKTNSISN